MDRWVIFDADNTLWQVESLYDDARRQLTEILAARGANSAVVAEIQQAIDHDLYQTLGYSAQRFPTSFERTLLHFFPDSSEEERSRIRGIAERVFGQPAVAHHALDKVLSKLKVHYRLGILTAGENWVQQSRLQQFSHRHHFTAAEVVAHKDAGTFLNFAQKHEVDRSRSWMVGDSLRSDIIPAHAAGLNCILVASHNWRRVEMEQMNVPDYVYRVDDLTDILGIIPMSVN